MNVATIAGAELEALGQHGLRGLRINNQFCEALISLQGAQILEFRRNDQAENESLLWCSTLNQYHPNKAIRGGIPICFPWFGANPEQSGAPSHGFARILEWDLIDLKSDDHGHLVCFELKNNLKTEAYWPHAFLLQLEIRCGASLELCLKLHNPNATAIQVEFLWHSYFKTALMDAKLEGLNNCDYIDQLDANQIKHQHEQTLNFKAETDRIYLQSPGQFRLNSHKGCIDITSDATSTVVWTPWADKAKRLGDIQANAWQDFLCVESGQLGTQACRLLPKQTIHYQLKIQSVIA